MAARTLPPRPNVEHYRKQAKALLKRLKAGDSEAVRQVAKMHPRLVHLPHAALLKKTFVLADAQLAIAREHQFDSWPKFIRHLEDLRGERSHAAVWRDAERAIVAGDVVRLQRLLRDHADVFRDERPQSTWLGGLRPDYDAGDARAIIVRTHHFDSWEQFEAHARAIKNQDSPV